MISMPPNHYCIIKNPVRRQEDGTPELSPYGEVEVRHGDVEIRMQTDYRDPFPLYYREKVQEKPTPLKVVDINKALRVQCVRPFEDKKVGDEWLVRGPCTYIPKIEEKIVETIEAQVIGSNQALRLRARRDCVDRNGTKRTAGEEWLIREEGAYLPDIDEQV